MKKFGVLFIGACMCLGFMGCSKTKEFDAKGYVKSYLDTAYMNDQEAYEVYAEFEGETPEKLRERWDSQVYEEVGSYLMKKYPVEELDSVTNLLQNLTEARKLAKYEVLKAEKTEDGFQVKVKVEPASVFETWKKYAGVEEVRRQAENYSGIENTLAAFLMRAIEENVYGEPKEIDVQVTQDGEDTYIGNSQKEKLEKALFPKRMPSNVIYAMFTYPTEDLFSEKAITIIGEGAEEIQDSDEVVKEQERIAENWRMRVGEEFVPGSLDKFLEESALSYLAKAHEEGKELSVKEISREEKSETAETYAVTILNGGIEETVKLEFIYDEDDRIKSVSFK